MRKAVLFTAVVIVAAVGALLWYNSTRAAEPDHIEKPVGTPINWTIPPDPDCNAEKMTITINYKSKNNGLRVDGNQVIGNLALGPNDSDSLPTYIYVDVFSEVAGLCSSWRWWQINVTIPLSKSDANFGSKNEHNVVPATPLPPTPTPAPTPYAEVAGCSYYHDHGQNGSGSWGTTDCLDHEFATELTDLYMELYGEGLGFKSSINTYYHNHADSNDHGGVKGHSH